LLLLLSQVSIFIFIFHIQEAHAREQEVHDAIGYTEEQISELKKEIQRTRDEQLANITNMVSATPCS
jgi:hypothetical protein